MVKVQVLVLLQNRSLQLEVVILCVHIVQHLRDLVELIDEDVVATARIQHWIELKGDVLSVAVLH